MFAACVECTRILRPGALLAKTSSLYDMAGVSVMHSVVISAERIRLRHRDAALTTSQNTDPHYEMILYCVMLAFGRRNAAFLRSQKRWQPLLPLLMDHVRLDVDPEIDDHFYGSASGPSSGARAVAVPIEAKLRSLSVRLLYEVCRVQKMSLQDLRE